MCVCVIFVFDNINIVEGEEKTAVRHRFNDNLRCGRTDGVLLF